MAIMPARLMRSTGLNGCWRIAATNPCLSPCKVANVSWPSLRASGAQYDWFACQSKANHVRRFSCKLPQKA